jgi:glutathione synthase/RimK-type ligase-like ATP-grasp enzyme
MKRLVWLCSDRGSTKENDFDRVNYRDAYAAVGAEVGCKVEFVSPELLDLGLGLTNDGRIMAYLDGAHVTPADVIFVTEHYAFPSLVGDAWACTTAFAALEDTGFYLPIPPRLSLTANDKWLSYVHLAPHLHATRTIPSARIVTGRDVHMRSYRQLLADLRPPFVVKPASWGGDMGIIEVEDETELLSVLRLASAGELIVIVQPRLGPEGMTAYKLYCLDREVRFTELSLPPQGHVAGTLEMGGTEALTETPPVLLEEARRLLPHIPAAYVTLDFIHVDGVYYFVEFELDGTLTADKLQIPTVREFLADRFRAYVRDHERFLIASRERTSVPKLGFGMEP